MKYSSFCAVIAALMVNACASGGSAPPRPSAYADSLHPQYQTGAIDKAMDSALKQAEASGDTQQILSLLEQTYRRNPKDANLAARYARALREDDQIKAAIRILTPFTKGENPNENAVTENAMAHLALGDFEGAENLALNALGLNDKNARAYLALGTAQDARGKHQDAEISFRQGIKNWKGNPAPIMNNLALNLASQGHLVESLTLIKKAQKEAPHNMELERNKRIISTLLETAKPLPPAPPKKPGI